MSVSLVHATRDAEALIVRMARVSNPSNEANLETAPRLLRFLIHHQHWSPFQMASMCVKIETQRDIAAQILRHSSFSFQEFSTRYARTEPAEIPRFRRQDAKNRQSSHDDISPAAQDEYARAAAQVIAQAFTLYEVLLADGVAKETARRILPLCTPTTLYMHGTLRSWIHFIRVRTELGTQLEHRQVAEACRDIFWQQFPTIAAAAFDDL